MTHATSTTPPPARKLNDRIAICTLTVCLLFALGQLSFNAFTLDTWMDEGKYLMKGYWYLTGQLQPYSVLDPTWYMPIPFYSVGWMERLFGVGYLPGRALAMFFAMACLILAYLTGSRIGHSRLAGVSAVVLIVGYPVTLTYFATATPYALVSCLSLALVFSLLEIKSRRLAYAVSGVLLWALLFTRPNMLPIAMIPTGWALLIERERKIECLSIAFLTFLAASAGTVWYFGQGLLDVILETPGLSQIMTALGVPPSPISKVLPLTTSPLDPILPLSDVPTYFNRYFFKPYLAVSLITLAAIVFRISSAWRDPSARQIKPIDLILGYFWITVVLHYLLSLSYCVDCIIPYTNYFLPVGALGASALLGDLQRTTRGVKLSHLAFGTLSVAAVAMHVFPSFPTLLRPTSDSVRVAATALSSQLQPLLPAASRVLVLSDRVEATQAVWLAGGVVEPRSFYLPSTYRQPKPELSQVDRDRVESVMWDANLWSEGSMRRALSRQFDTVLVERRATYGATLTKTISEGIPFGDLIATHFRATATLKIDDRTFELYQRRE